MPSRRGRLGAMRRDTPSRESSLRFVLWNEALRQPRSGSTRRSRPAVTGRGGPSYRLQSAVRVAAVRGRRSKAHGRAQRHWPNAYREHVGGVRILWTLWMIRSPGVSADKSHPVRASSPTGGAKGRTTPRPSEPSRAAGEAVTPVEWNAAQRPAKWPHSTRTLRALLHATVGLERRSARDWRASA
jgi:hypothetical protein